MRRRVAFRPRSWPHLPYDSRVRIDMDLDLGEGRADTDVVTMPLARADVHADRTGAAERLERIDRAPA